MQLGLEPEIVPANIDESKRRSESGADYVQRVARDKVHAALARLEPGRVPVLAADTSVVLGEEVLGKPADEADGMRMLMKLSGQTHEVYTAVAVADEQREVIALSRSEVRFRVISPQEITGYWQSGEPKDKAGAYAIQGLGAIFIEEIRGSYSGVMGLPIFEAANLLESFGYRFLSNF